MINRKGTKQLKVNLLPKTQNHLSIIFNVCPFYPGKIIMMTEKRKSIWTLLMILRYAFVVANILTMILTLVTLAERLKPTFIDTIGYR